MLAPGDPGGRHARPALDARRLRAALAPPFASCEWHGRLDSTNERAARLAELPALVACADQRAGRGRRGRTWLSAPEHSLTFSIAVPLAETAAGLSLAVAVGVAEALRGCGAAPRLKWPNDLIGPGGGKLGGVLVELHAAPRRAVCGVGLNLAAGPALRARLPGGEALDEHGPRLERDALLLELAPALLAAVERWRTAGCAPVRDRWLALTLHRPGDGMMVTAPGGTRRALAYEGLGDEGELLARAPGGALERIASAEVELDGRPGG